MKIVHLLVTVKLEEGFTQAELVNDVKNAVKSYPGSLHPDEAIEGMRRPKVRVVKLVSSDQVSEGKGPQLFSTKLS